MRELITNPEGRLSTADAFLFFGAGIVFTLWLVAGIGIFSGRIVWETYSGWMSWGRDFLFISVVPYVAKRFSYRPGV